MKRNSGNISIIIGASILALMTFGLVGIVYSLYINETTQEEPDSNRIAEKNNPYQNLKREKNFVTTPVTEQKSNGGGRLEPEKGIPTGTYSNPPTTVNSFGDYDTTIDRPFENYDSSIESNRLSQQRFGHATPDYSRPSSGNNFNNSSNNSLVDSLENDDFLDVPDPNSHDAVETPSLLESNF